MKQIFITPFNQTSTFLIICKNIYRNNYIYNNQLNSIKQTILKPPLWISQEENF